MLEIRTINGHRQMVAKLVRMNQYGILMVTDESHTQMC